MKLTQVISEKEFKRRCIEKEIKYTKYLWNYYMDKAWDTLEKELEITT